MITIRKAEEADFEAIWRIFHQVVQQGDTYAYDPETRAYRHRELGLVDAYVMHRFL